MSAHRIAVIPGDGIGKEVVPEGLRVLEAVGTRFGIAFEFAHFDWDCDYYVKHGRMMPEDWFETLSRFDAIFYGAVGWPATVPDHVSLWGSLIQFRRGFDQYVNMRPCRLMPGIATPLANRKPGDIDFVVVRENTEGEYSSVGGRMYDGTEREIVFQESVFSRKGTDRVIQVDVGGNLKDLFCGRSPAVTSLPGVLDIPPIWCSQCFASMPVRHPQWDCLLLASASLFRRKLVEDTVNGVQGRSHIWNSPHRTCPLLEVPLLITLHLTGHVKCCIRTCWPCTLLARCAEPSWWQLWPPAVWHCRVTRCTGHFAINHWLCFVNVHIVARLVHPSPRVPRG